MMEEVSGDRSTLPQVVVNGIYLEGGLEELQFMHDSDSHAPWAEGELFENQPNPYRGVPVRDGSFKVGPALEAKVGPMPTRPSFAQEPRTPRSAKMSRKISELSSAMESIGK